MISARSVTLAGDGDASVRAGHLREDPLIRADAEDAADRAANEPAYAR